MARRLWEPPHGYCDGHAWAAIPARTPAHALIAAVRPLQELLDGIDASA
jgi:hypothetical protein